MTEVFGHVSIMDVRNSDDTPFVAVGKHTDRLALVTLPYHMTESQVSAWLTEERPAEVFDHIPLSDVDSEAVVA